MEKTVFEMFRREIKDQCELALIAREDLEKALREFDEAYKRGLTKPEERPYILRIWQFIHAFLVMAANISKLLDPIEPTRPRGYPRKVWKAKGPELWAAMNERGIELRKFFSIDQDSPLIKKSESKVMPRDYLEHFDAFLQEWIIATQGQDVQYAHRSIGPSKKRIEMKEAKEIGCQTEIDIKNVLQFFDYEDYVVVLGGKEYYLRPVIEAIEKLLKE